jgi:hypothetical protein
MLRELLEHRYEVIEYSYVSPSVSDRSVKRV